MDEKVIANLGFFLVSSSLAHLATFPLPARTIPSPALIIPFPVNKLPIKLAPKVPKSVLKNPPLCSLVSFSIVLLTPFIIKYQNFLELQ